MLIGELAEMLEVTPKTLRHYEKIDLIPHPERTSNGYRFFGPRAARRAQLVVNLRRLGLTLEEIRTLLDRGDGRSLRQRLLGRLDEQIRDHELGIAQLQGERDELQARYDALVGTPREREGDCICAALLAPCGCKEPSKKKKNPLDLALRASSYASCTGGITSMSEDRQVTPQVQQYRPVFTLDDGPIEEVHAFWLAGMSCDGCSIAAVGAQNPSVEQLVNARLPGLPRIVLHHPVLSVAAGKEFMKAHHLARAGKLGAPYVVLYEGSVADESIAAEFGGYWSAMGVDEDSCRVTLKSETRRVRGYFLPLIVRFDSHRAYASHAPLRNEINRSKQTWLRLEGAQESNPCIVVDAGVRDGRFDQRTRSGCINGGKAKKPHFLSMALKSGQRFPAEGL